MKKALKIVGATTAALVVVAAGYGYYLGRKEDETDFSDLDNLFQSPDEDEEDVVIDKTKD